MKLRLLNGSHSALAYLGCLAGFEHIAEVMGEPDFVTFVRRMMAEEVAPTLAVPTDLAAYQASLLERFANPAIRHRTAQIAMDGSQKLPQRLLGTIRDQLRAGGPIRHLDARGRRLDALRRRPRRAGPADRGRRSAGRALRRDRRRAPGATRPRWPQASSRCARCSATTCRASRASRAAVTGWLRA